MDKEEKNNALIDFIDDDTKYIHLIGILLIIDWETLFSLVLDENVNWILFSIIELLCASFILYGMYLIITTIKMMRNHEEYQKLSKLKDDIDKVNKELNKK